MHPIHTENFKLNPLVKQEDNWLVRNLTKNPQWKSLNIQSCILKPNVSKYSIEAFIEGHFPADTIKETQYKENILSKKLKRFF